MDKEQLSTTAAVTESFYTALKSMSQWTFPYSKFPRQPFAVREERRAYRLGPISNVYVERGDVEEGVRKLIDGLKPGQMLRLVAGTGTGKSTLVAVWLAKRSSSVVIAVTPRPLMAKTLASYVKANVAIGGRADCQVAYCVTAADVYKLTRPAVAYMGASDFLCMCALRVKVLSEMGVRFAYIDESHEKIPQYEVISYLKSVGEFEDTVLLMGSATSSNQDMEYRSGGITRVHKDLQPELLMYDDTENLTSRSPLHQSSIDSRTLVYVPSSAYFPSLRRYYTQYALPVLELPEYVGSSKYFSNITTELARNKRPSVLLATQEHQTCYSLPVDTVVDCGVTQDLICDMENDVFTVHERVATVAERVQRCGRVGRFQSGYSYTVDAVAEYEIAGVQSGCELYVALWCKAFGVRVEDVRVSYWFDYVARLPTEFIKVGLYASVHPALLFPYLTSSGTTDNALYGIMCVNTNNKSVIRGTHSPELIIHAEAWPVRRLSVPGAPSWMREYKSKFEVPVRWQPWCAAMYHSLKGKDLSVFLKASNAGSVSSFDSSRSSLSGSFRPLRYASPGFHPCSDASVSSFDTINDWDAGVQAKTAQPKSPVQAWTEGVVAADAPAVENVRRRYRPSVRVAGENSPRGSVSSDETIEIRSPAAARAAAGLYAAECSPDCAACAEGDVLNRATAGFHASEVPERRLVRNPRPTPNMSSSRMVPYTTKSVGRDLVQSYEDRGVYPWTGIASPSTSGSLVPVNLRALQRRILVPCSQLYWDTFVSYRLSPTAAVNFYNKLKFGRVMLSAADDATRIDHFMACINLWNFSVSDAQQRAAQPNTKFHNMFSNFETFEKYDTRFQRLIALFLTFELHGYGVAYRPMLQTGSEISLVGLERNVASALYAYGWAGPLYKRVQDRASLITTSVYHSGTRVGSAFKHGMVVYTCLHVYVDPTVKPSEFSTAPLDVYEDESRDLVALCFGSQAAVGSPASVRQPVESELVVVFLPVGLDVVAVGVFRVLTVGGKCLYSGRLPNGASGAPVVALVDGAVLGVHRGEVPFPDGSVVGEFVCVDYVS